MSTPTPYDLNIPVFDNSLAASQGPFLNNFSQLYNAFLVNHVALDAVTSAGNHKIIELLEQKQGFQTSVGELSIYSKNVEGQTDQLFLRYQGNGTEVQLTNYQIYSLPQPINGVQFFSFLPGKILLYFGIITISGYPFKLNLLPPVAKNIISCNFCAGTTPSQPPLVNPIASSDGIIRQLNLITPFSLPITNQLMNYFIMANI